MKIAVIGSGVSGLAISYLLNKKHDITLFEKNDYVGGHARTVEINDNGKRLAVDTGFIVFNMLLSLFFMKFFFNRLLKFFS